MPDLSHLKLNNLTGNQNFTWDLPLLGCLLFWLLIYSWGAHPDAPWGDGLGYALAVESGWDWSLNANSHFLYLNFHHLLFILFPFQDSLQLLNLASVFWAIVALYALYAWQKSKLGPSGALLAVQALATCFVFWRHANLPEVYTFSLCCWIWLLHSLEMFLCSPQSFKNQHLVAAVLVLGLLVHIQLVLVFPYVLFLLIKYRNILDWRVFLWLLLPLGLAWNAVEMMHLHSWQAILTEDVGPKFLEPDFNFLWKGPLFVSLLLVWQLPLFFLGLMLPGAGQRIRPFFQRSGFWWMVLPVLAFAARFPEPGIYVFLLSVCLLLCPGLVLLWKDRLPTSILLGFFLVFQVAWFFGQYQLIQTFAPSSFVKKQEVKGGIGFLCLPWAKNNVASILQKTENLPADSLAEFSDWNVRQALAWKKRHPTGK
jgi:hypothetical protein